MSRPAEHRAVLLTVDDDPSVSRAVSRDLRRRYGRELRVVRAGSGHEGLEVLRELKLRGQPVAAVLADYRMPEMSGIDFLEAAMDLFPRARRALLTAYADTDAAIAAINVVDVDHYLLKPWDPPEEKLYPVVDAMLDAYRREPDTSAAETKVIGNRWSRESYEARDFLACNAVPYRWLADSSPEAARLLGAAGLTDPALPVVITPGGATLVAPSAAELADAVGLATTPATDFYDLIVVGGAGGQAGQSSRIENYLGFPDGISGAQLTDRARRQAVRFGTEILTSCDVVGLRAEGSARVLTFDDGREVAAHAVIIATGVSYRELEAPGVAELTGRGVYYGSAMTEAAHCTDEDVYLVGGANSAGQAAVYFAKYAPSVTLLVRGGSLEAGMSHYLVEQLRALENVHVRLRTRVNGAFGDGRLERLCLTDAEGRREEVPAGHLFVFIGARPHTAWLEGVVERDERGFIRTGPDLMADGRRPAGWRPERDPWLLESSLPGVFVAGDVRSDSVKRVASAVGEGAMAVTFVHRYLEGP